MQIIFQTNKRQKEFSSSKTLIKKHGKHQADLIEQRLNELRAAEALEDLRNLPGPHCHELRQNFKGQLAVHLDGPYRLIFEPAHEPIPKKEDGGLDWRKVTCIRIVEVVNYHG